MMPRTRVLLQPALCLALLAGCASGSEQRSMDGGGR